MSYNQNQCRFTHSPVFYLFLHQFISVLLRQVVRTHTDKGAFNYYISALGREGGLAKLADTAQSKGVGWVSELLLI